jgi:hypothetical protein
MERFRTDPATRILRRVKRRRLNLTRLLKVIRAFRHSRRTPLHRAVAMQGRVHLESRRSLRTTLDDLLRDQWRLRRELEGPSVRRVDTALWTAQLNHLTRRVRIQERSTSNPAPAWEKLPTDTDTPLRVLCLICGACVVVIGAMATAAAF